MPELVPAFLFYNNWTKSIFFFKIEKDMESSHSDRMIELNIL